MEPLPGRSAVGHLAASACLELDELAMLGADWDSYGATPPSPASITTARRLIDAVEQHYGHEIGERIAPFDVAPIPRGGVQIEWRGKALHLEVEVGPDGDLSYLIKKIQPTGREYEEAHNVAWDALWPQIARVLLS